MTTEASIRPTVTAVITSCRRFDLLEKTLQSFLEHNDYPLEELIIIEDSNDRGIYEVQPLLDGVPHRIIFNDGNIGQIASIDKAYSQVKSEYVFHIEDDWIFTSRGVIGRAIEVLQKEPRASMVTVRDDADMPRYVRSLKMRQAGTAIYKLAFPELHFRWYSFTFNPGLRRMKDYRTLSGGYSAIGDEMAISHYYKLHKWDMAWMIGGGVKHAGDTRSVYGNGVGYRKSTASGGLSRLFKTENLRKWRESLGRHFWHRLRMMGIDTEPLQRRKW